MNLVSWGEFKKFEACQRKGFVRLDWKEGLSQIDLVYSHEAWAVGRKIVLHVLVDHVVLNPETMRKKYVASLSFTHKSDTGDVFYRAEPHTEMELESALAYAEWQATVVFRLIEGHEAEPLPQEEKP